MAVVKVLPHAEPQRQFSIESDVSVRTAQSESGGHLQEAATSGDVPKNSGSRNGGPHSTNWSATNHSPRLSDGMVHSDSCSRHRRDQVSSGNDVHRSSAHSASIVCLHHQSRVSPQCSCENSCNGGSAADTSDNGDDVSVEMQPTRLSGSTSASQTSIWSQNRSRTNLALSHISSESSNYSNTTDGHTEDSLPRQQYTSPQSGAYSQAEQMSRTEGDTESHEGSHVAAPAVPPVQQRQALRRESSCLEVDLLSHSLHQQVQHQSSAHDFTGGENIVVHLPHCNELELLEYACSSTPSDQAHGCQSVKLTVFNPRSGQHWSIEHKLPLIQKQFTTLRKALHTMYDSQCTQVVHVFVQYVS